MSQSIPVASAVIDRRHSNERYRKGGWQRWARRAMIIAVRSDMKDFNVFTVYSSDFDKMICVLVFSTYNNEGKSGFQ